MPACASFGNCVTCRPEMSTDETFKTLWSGQCWHIGVTFSRHILFAANCQKHNCGRWRFMLDFYRVSIAKSKTSTVSRRRFRSQTQNFGTHCVMTTSSLYCRFTQRFCSGTAACHSHATPRNTLNTAKRTFVDSSTVSLTPLLERCWHQWPHCSVCQWVTG